MNILSKRQLGQAITESLFHPVHGRSLACMKKSKFDLGKYKPGTVTGRPVPEHMRASVYAVWVEPRRDRHGPYDALYCYSVHDNGPFVETRPA